MSDVDSEELHEGPTIGTYEGERNDKGQRHGQGKNLFPNGDSYDGQYSEGLRGGHGTYRWKVSGARYVGSYAEDKKHGEGLLVYPDGSKYRGGFVAGKRSGFGTYLYANGDVYKGHWEDDAKHGPGEYTYGAVGSTKKGIWVHNMLNGSGQIIHADHHISGHWASNDLMVAPVKITFLSTGYTQTCANPIYLGVAAVPSEITA
ncbi:hypothetical protein SmJEL517_g01580 [Synchytrium microbalum]|uniref:Uncharacterized protein n=1 Tax=Synchytrium microbalum TaxID=1806994 RepID=A0A507C5H0_9FUNG|nr:uncharacterized protein SmJEL517_g01580 [Synchytrium microbalum]TPX36237.1 hypothetical protein SmJEL517_g01580 [Synchytrium microbalum]